MSDNNPFFYLNRDNRWPDFHGQGLELRKDGALQLAALPLLEGDLPGVLADLPNPSGPAGIAVTADGSVYFSDPSQHQFFQIDACDHSLAAVPCLGGEGGGPGRFRTPRGILFHPVRREWFVADSGNHRIQIFAPDRFQLLDIWGQPDVYGEPKPGSEPGRFNTPWSLVSDAAGNVYVVDYGNGRVQKFTILGEVVPAFWETLQEAGLQKPVDIAAVDEGEITHLYVLAQDKNARWTIFPVDSDGHPLRDAQGDPIAITLEQAQQPQGLAVHENAVYVGDNGRRRVRVFKRNVVKQDGGFVEAGEGVGYRGPVAGLALDGQGGLLVHTGSAGVAPLRLLLNKGYGASGILWSQAIKAPDPRVIWHRLRAETAPLSADTHLQFFLYTSDDKADPPIDINSDHPFADPKWQAASSNATDLFIGGGPVCCLWIGAVFSGNGAATPVLQQIRVEFDHSTYLQYLPAIYSNDRISRDFLVRFLSLFESLFSEIEADINNLSRLFDPDAVPRAFLPWFAGWLALELNEDWSEAAQRKTIAQAFESYGKRGTVEGLQQALQLFAGVHAVIEEPILNSAWWALPVATKPEDNASALTDSETWQATENSILGFTTRLVSAQPQGAVLGSSATLDQSHLIRNEDFGVPLFEDIAHRFSVLIYRGELRCADTLARVRAVLEQEKPAHTAYQLCIVEPHMQVGFQARLGIDTVVAGPWPDRPLGDGSELGRNAALGGPPGGRIGPLNRIGITTRVG